MNAFAIGLNIGPSGSAAATALSTSSLTRATTSADNRPSTITAPSRSRTASISARSSPRGIARWSPRSLSDVRHARSSRLGPTKNRGDPLFESLRSVRGRPQRAQRVVEGGARELDLVTRSGDDYLRCGDARCEFVAHGLESGKAPARHDQLRERRGRKRGEGHVGFIERPAATNTGTSSTAAASRSGGSSSGLLPTASKKLDDPIVGGQVAIPELPDRSVSVRRSARARRVTQQGLRAASTTGWPRAGVRRRSSWTGRRRNDRRGGRLWT